MTSTSSKLKYCVQKTTIQRDVGLRIYYFAYMNSPPLFRVPSILRSCYSNYELKRKEKKNGTQTLTHAAPRMRNK